jgi:hypothetical protein
VVLQLAPKIIRLIGFQIRFFWIKVSKFSGRICVDIVRAVSDTALAIRRGHSQPIGL